MLRLLPVFSLLLLGLLGAGCAGGSATGRGAQLPLAPAAAAPALSAWPATLPLDGLQPWEQLTAQGQVATGPGGRAASAINADSEFSAGVERFLEGGAVADNGEASRLTSSSGTLSYAIYRLPLGGAEPGAVSVDANTASGSGYFVGLANYGTGVWEWHGPYSDNHVRFGTTSASGADFTSGLGNLFVCVAAWDGAVIDVVGIGASAIDPGDTTPPPAPTAPAVTAASGSLLVEWIAVAAGDLAGYQIYYSSQDFSSPDEPGVQALDSLEGLTRHVISGLGAATVVRLSAVDISGNVSGLSPSASAVPLAGTVDPLTVTVSAPNGRLNDVLSMNASGAESYDFDLDGDGSFDLTGNTSGTANVDTSSLGLIRVGVRGSSGGGTAYACGGVSVLVSSNQRPLAVAYCDVSTGAAPLSVSFTGMSAGNESLDADGSLAGGGWDFDGNGIYGDETPPAYDAGALTHVTSASYTYLAPGVYNAKLKVVDDEGAWDVDTLTVTVSGEDFAVPKAVIVATPADCYPGDNIELDASGSRPADGATLVLYEWELNGDGQYDDGTTSPPDSDRQTLFLETGIHEVGVRVSDSLGGSSTAATSITIHGWTHVDVHTTPGAQIAGWNGALSVINGHPAISYRFDGGMGTGVLYYVRSATATGDTEAAWSNKVAVPTGGGDDVYYTNLLEVDGNPAVAFFDNNSGTLRYVRADTASGSLPADWGAALTVDDGAGGTDEVGQMLSMCIVNGHPAISYYNSTDTSLKYAWSTGATGALGSWLNLEVDNGGSVGNYTSLAVVAAGPAISYYDLGNSALMYVLGGDLDGSVWGTPVTVYDTPDQEGKWTSLCNVAGHPAIVFLRYLLGTDFQVCYVRSLTADGDAAAEWPAPVDCYGLDSTFEKHYCSLATISGQPAIAFYDSGPNHLFLSSSSSTTGTFAADWDEQDVTEVAPGVDLGSFCSLAEVGGRPAISYFNETQDSLVYSILY